MDKFHPFFGFASRPAFDDYVSAQIRYLHPVSRISCIHAETDPKTVIHQNNGLYSTFFWGKVRDEGILDNEMPLMPPAANGVAKIAALDTKTTFEQTAKTASCFGA